MKKSFKQNNSNNQKERAACLMEDVLWKSFGWLRNLKTI